MNASVTEFDARWQGPVGTSLARGLEGCARYRVAEARTSPLQAGLVRQHERVLSALSAVAAGRHDEALRGHRELRELRERALPQGCGDAGQRALAAVYDRAIAALFGHLAGLGPGDELERTTQALRQVHASLAVAPDCPATPRPHPDSSS